MFRFPVTMLAAGLLLTTALPLAAQEADPYSGEEATEFFATLEADGRLGTTIELLRASQATWFLERDAEDDEEYTLFAPSDEAFAAIPPGVLDALLQEDNRVVLSELLEHHLLPADGRTAAEMENGEELEPAVGENLEVGVNGDAITVGGAEVIGADLQTNDGVVHVIDAVLVPSLIRDALIYRGVWPEEG